MHWFGEGPETEREHRWRVQREAGYQGAMDSDGNPVMTRVSPADGQSLTFTDKGWSGRGTPDETRPGVRR